MKPSNKETVTILGRNWKRAVLVIDRTDNPETRERVIRDMLKAKEHRSFVKKNPNFEIPKMRPKP